ncbi:MAG TPA: M28 family peptidase, partial [Bacteroidales bacterium]|nr:M28 family peptidase [Bacteroidales bacterium]
SKKVIIALFTSEETRLDGSNALAKRIKAQQIPLKYVINFDMIGTTMIDAPKKVFITGFDKSNLAVTANTLLQEDFLLKDAQTEDMELFRYSDNFSFYRELNIPAHTLSTFNMRNFDCYHRTCDEVSEIDVKNLESIIQKSTTFIIELLKQNSQIALN